MDDELIVYACRDEWDSLRPVPPGATRREYYCPYCQAERCLFTGELVADRQREDGDGWVTAIGFAGGLGIARKDMYRYIQEGLPAERRPRESNGDQRIWCVRPAAARLWLLDHGPERLMRVIMDGGRC